MEEIVALLAQPPFTPSGNSNQISCIFSNYLVFEKPPHPKKYNPSVRAGEYGEFLDIHILNENFIHKTDLKVDELIVNGCFTGSYCTVTVQLIIICVNQTTKITRTFVISKWMYKLIKICS